MGLLTKEAETLLVKLQKRSAAARAKWEALAAEASRVRLITSPYSVNAPSVPRAEQLRAQAREPELMSELAIAEADFDEAEKALRQEESDAAMERRAEALERLRPKVPKLDKALREVEKILDSMKADDDTCGAAVTQSVRVLVPDELREGLAETWRRRAVAAGLL